MVLTSFEGEKYEGRFDISEKSYSWIGGNSEVGDRYESKSWYEGIGDIKNLETGEVQKFLFKSREKRSKFKSLEEAFNLDIPEEKIINQKGIYDLVLGNMYDQTKEEYRNEATIIPQITPGFLPDEKELFHADLIKNPSYLESFNPEI